jgi:hypothetical protein
MLKDERLFYLSDKYNVARFISIGPDGLLRYLVSSTAIPGIETYRKTKRMIYPTESTDFQSTAAVYKCSSSNIDAFLSTLEQEGVKAVNIRSFRKDQEQGNPFVFYLPITDTVRIYSELCKLVDAGYYCILHEWLDTDDGGLSGCIYQNNTVTIAPGLTPRDMETEPNLAHLKLDSPIVAHLEKQLQFSMEDMDFNPAKRYEFSVHTQPVGHKQEQVIVWEISDTTTTEKFPTHHIWPSHLSRHIGDKLYGLLVAQDVHIDLTLPTISIDVIDFLKDTQNNESLNSMTSWSSPKIILRPCPPEQLPGELDSIVLPNDANIYQELMTYFKNVDTTDVDAVVENYKQKNLKTFIIQPYEPVAYSGAYYSIGPYKNGYDIYVEGVQGHGNKFMVNEEDPEVLPDNLTKAVRNIGNKLNDKLKLPTRGEWIAKVDEKGNYHVQLVQLHIAHDICDYDTYQDLDMCVRYIYKGSLYEDTEEDKNIYLQWSASDGLDKLRYLVKTIVAIQDAVKFTDNTVALGIEIKGYIGLTTHAADILRKYQIISKMTYTTDDRTSAPDQFDWYVRPENNNYN